MRRITFTTSLTFIIGVRIVIKNKQPTHFPTTV